MPSATVFLFLRMCLSVCKCTACAWRNRWEGSDFSTMDFRNYRSAPPPPLPAPGRLQTWGDGAALPRVSISGTREENTHRFAENDKKEQWESVGGSSARMNSFAGRFVWAGGSQSASSSPHQFANPRSLLLSSPTTFSFMQQLRTGTPP